MITDQHQLLTPLLVLLNYIISLRLKNPTVDKALLKISVKIESV